MRPEIKSTRFFWRLVYSVGGFVQIALNAPELTPRFFKYEMSTIAASASVTAHSGLPPRRAS